MTMVLLNPKEGIQLGRNVIAAIQQAPAIPQVLSLTPVILSPSHQRRGDGLLYYFHLTGKETGPGR